MSTTQVMSVPQIKQIVLEKLGKIAPEADLESLSPDVNVREALDIDSFDHLNFLIALHEELGVEIPEADYGQLVSINGVTQYLAARMR